MNVKTKTKYGTINISNDALTTLVAETVLNIYGVVGLADKTSLHKKVTEILKRETYPRGVFVNQDKRSVSVDIYIVVAKDVKITEVLCEVQKQIKYVLGHTFNIHSSKINVFAHSLQKVN